MLRPHRLIRWFLSSGCLTLLACSSPIPLPEAPQFEDQATFSADPDIGQLITKRLDVAQARATDANAWTALGFAFEANDFKAQAVASYEHASLLATHASDPPVPPTDAAKNFYRLGIVHKALGDVAAATQAFAGATEHQPDLTAAHWQHGYCLLDLGDLDRADSSFEAAIGLDSRGLPARLGRVRVALQKGQAAVAERRLEAMRKEFPDHPYILFLLADAWRQQDRQDDVAQLMRRANPEAPQWPDPWQHELQDLRVGFAADMRRAQEALEQGMLDIALPLLEELHQKRPEDIVATTNLSAAFIGSQRADEAIELLQTAYEEHPQRYTVAMNMAAAQFAAKDFEQALEWAERAHQLDPLKPRPLEMAAQLHLRQKRLDDALISLEKARELAPKNLTTLQYLGGLHSQAGRWKKAQEVYLQAVQIAPKRGDLALRLANSFLHLGRPRYAQKALQQARSLGIPSQLQPEFERLEKKIDVAVRRLEEANP